MSRTREQSGETAAKRVIREAYEEAWHARRALNRGMPNPSRDLRREFCAALADFRALLYKHRDQRALDTPWEEREPDVDAVEDLLTETVTQVNSLDRLGNPKDTEVYHAAGEATPAFLKSVHDELNDIYNELGFAEKPEQLRDRFHIAAPDDEDHPEPVNKDVPKPGSE